MIKRQYAFATQTTLCSVTLLQISLDFLCLVVTLYDLFSSRYLKFKCLYEMENKSRVIRFYVYNVSYSEELAVVDVGK